ncbi:hypothetical protein ACFL5B_02915 [Candidatus Latescibacterota bacterium]
MKTRNQCIWILIITAVLTLAYLPAYAQRFGAMDPGSISGRVMISNGPGGPIHGGESAVTSMVLMDGWVYGSTGATWGAQSCHLFRSDGETVEHVLNITDKLPGQVKVCNLVHGPRNTLVGGTTTYNEIFDDTKKKYNGGFLFSFDPRTNAFVDLGIISPGQGINCVAIDTLHTRIYCVTYPDAHLFAFNYETREKKDYGQVMLPWRVKDLGKVSWRGVPKVLMIDDAGTVYFSAYYDEGAKKDDQGILSNTGRVGGRIMRLAYGDEKPVFTGAVIPTQKGMHNDPLYENTIVSAIKARDGGFWCGSSVDGFLFKFYPSTSTVVNKGKAFNYWNLRSLAYGNDGKLYMLGGRDYDNSWLMCYDTHTGSIDCLGWPSNTTQCSTICADKEGRILIGENLRNSFIYVYGKSK